MTKVGNQSGTKFVKFLSHFQNQISWFRIMNGHSWASAWCGLQNGPTCLRTSAFATENIVTTSKNLCLNKICVTVGDISHFPVICENFVFFVQVAILVCSEEIHSRENWYFYLKSLNEPLMHFETNSFVPKLPYRSIRGFEWQRTGSTFN